MADSPLQDSVSNLPGRKYRRIVGFSILAVGLIAAGWLSLRWWIERESERDIFEREQPKIALQRLTSWSTVMATPKRWRWLQAEAARKSNDRARLHRFCDEAGSAGLSTEEANGPKWLMDAASGNIQNAKANLAKLLLLYGKNRDEVYAAVVQGFLVKGNKPDANQVLKLWKEDTDGTPEFYYWQGVAAISNYELNRGEESLRKAIEARPGFQKARLELAELFIEQAQFNDARAEFEWLVQRMPDSPRVVVGLAKSLFSLGLADEAAAELSKLKDVDSLPTTELLLIAETNLESGNVDVAHHQAQVLLSRWPDALAILQLAANCESKLMNKAKSEELSAKASRSQTFRPEIDQMLAKLNDEPNNQILRRQMGELMMNYMDPGAGAGYLEIVAVVLPTDLKVHQLLATYYQRENNRERAIVHELIVKQLTERQSSTAVPQ